MIKNICVYGVGGVGGYFGVKMLEADTENNYNISFIARGEHLNEIKINGLILKTEDEKIVKKPHVATENVGEIKEEIDLLLLCVKSYDLTVAIQSIQNKISERTLILPLLNGVDIYERIRNVTEKGIIMPACVYVGTHVEKPGVISQKGGAARILMGPDPSKKNVDYRSIRTIFDELQINYSYSENPYTEIWTKYIFIAAYGLVTAATDKTIGMIYEDGKLKNDVAAIMQEIIDIANKKQIILDENILETSLNKATTFPYETKTSFQRDYKHPDKKDEREIFGQTIINFGKELGLSTSVTEKYYKLIS